MIVMHAVNRLYQHRKSLSTTVYKSRGQRVSRCDLCRLAKQHCICALKPTISSDIGFLLLMYDTEVLKPSNTGKLIADIFPQTFAFLWSRTDVDQQILDILKDRQWQPFVVFPGEFAHHQQQVYDQQLPLPSDVKPLFILLDGSWREAKKMFRKSPYLQHLPMLSIDPQLRKGGDYSSKYHIRKSAKLNQLATAEVAAHAVAIAGEGFNADILECWFDLYSYRYQKSVCQTNKGDPNAQARLTALLDNTDKLSKPCGE